MIHFFRKIRQRLLKKNKVGRYLLYASGEILLVVIGILIALQINNWNQKRQNEKLEIKYLQGIQTNLDNDIDELERHFQADTLKLDAYTFLIKSFNALSYTSMEQEIGSALFTTSRLNWFEGQNVVFEDLKFSGKLHLIQSDTIRYSIQVYYRLFEEVIKQEDMNNSQIIIYKDRFTQTMPFSQFIESTFDARWNSHTDSIDYSFLAQQEFSDRSSFIIDNLSQIKSSQFNSHLARIQLYDKAVSLKTLIDTYLKAKK